MSNDDAIFNKYILTVKYRRDPIILTVTTYLLNKLLCHNLAIKTYLSNNVILPVFLIFLTVFV